MTYMYNDTTITHITFLGRDRATIPASIHKRIFSGNKIGKSAKHMLHERKAKYHLMLGC